MSTDTYTVERSIRIEASPQEIFALVADFRRWTEWSPWEGLDPDLQRTYSGSESGPGASDRWSGNRKAGQGEMTILKAVEPSLITVDLRFDKPFKARNDMSFAIEEEGSGRRGWLSSRSWSSGSLTPSTTAAAVAHLGR